MTDRQTQSTLREWRRMMTHPVALVVFPGLALLLTLLAPYGTDVLLRPVPRFGYWLVMATATWSVAFFVTQPVLARLRPSQGEIVAAGAAALATGLAVAPTVVGVNALLLGTVRSWAELPAFMANIVAVAAVISVLLQLLDRDGPAPQAAPPPILDRLPLEKRGPLVALSVEDHYVRIRTTKGEEMVLMRLADAIRETEPAKGFQVHRSHWVALDRVRAARRDGDRAILTMEDGPEIPVSRRYLPLIREAGLLPR